MYGREYSFRVLVIIPEEGIPDHGEAAQAHHLVEHEGTLLLLPIAARKPAQSEPEGLLERPPMKAFLVHRKDMNPQPAVGETKRAGGVDPAHGHAELGLESRNRRVGGEPVQLVVQVPEKPAQGVGGGAPDELGPRDLEYGPELPPEAIPPLPVPRCIRQEENQRSVRHEFDRIPVAPRCLSLPGFEHGDHVPGPKAGSRHLSPVTLR